MKFGEYFEDCYICGSEQSLSVEYDDEVAADYVFCNCCGYTYQNRPIYDENNEIVRETLKFKIDDCLLIVRDVNNGKILWEEELGLLDGIDEFFLGCWFDGIEFSNLDLPYGSRNLCLIDDELYGNIAQYGDSIDVWEDGYGFTIYRPVKEQYLELGGGIIHIPNNDEDNTEDKIIVEKGITRQEMIEKIWEVRENNPDTEIWGTWLNEKTGSIEYIA